MLVLDLCVISPRVAANFHKAETYKGSDFVDATSKMATRASVLRLETAVSSRVVRTRLGHSSPNERLTTSKVPLFPDHLRNGSLSKLRKSADRAVCPRADEPQQPNLQREVFALKTDCLQLQTFRSSQRNLRHQGSRLQRPQRAKKRPDRVNFRNGSRTYLVVSANFIGHSAHDEAVRQLQQPLLVQFGKMNYASVPPRVRLGNNQGKFVGAEAFVAQIRRVPREEAEANIHSSLFQRRLNLSG